MARGGKHMRLFSGIALALATMFAISTGAAKAEVVRDDEGQSKFHQKTPVYVWQDTARKPQAVAIAVHGLSMHGRIYDVMAHKLASQGFVVLAPDLRGYGAWLKHRSHKDKSPDYNKSYEDLCDLVKVARGKYPNLPLYCIGESLGAGMAIRAAAEHPTMIDGLVLSSPALKRRLFLGQTLAEAAYTIAKPTRSVDLTPYIKKFASEDPRVVQETLNDPLVRKELTIWELVQTCNFMRPNLKFARRLPTTMPMLVMQGDNDRMLKTNGVVELLARAKSTDQTIRWFNGRGHLLLETDYVQPDTMQTVSGWLQEHVRDSQPTLTMDSSAHARFISEQVEAEIAPGLAD